MDQVVCAGLYAPFVDMARVQHQRAAPHVERHLRVINAHEVGNDADVLRRQTAIDVCPNLRAIDQNQWIDIEGIAIGKQHPVQDRLTVTGFATLAGSTTSAVPVGTAGTAVPATEAMRKEGTLLRKTGAGVPVV